MQEHNNAMLIALRVLTAVTHYQEPSPLDVEFLRGCAPLSANGRPDELACEVIQHALKNRSATRESAASV